MDKVFDRVVQGFHDLYFRTSFRFHDATIVSALSLGTLLIAVQIHGLHSWDLSVPLSYGTHDDIWQLTLTKALIDNGWILTNEYLGTPSIAHWHYHAAAQTSALHSGFMKLLSLFVEEAVRVQQTYYLLNFPLIAATTYLASRAVGCTTVASFCIGAIFAFTTFRLNNHFLAFLANYFVIPLSILPVVWIGGGVFERREPGNANDSTLLGTITSRYFIAGLGIVALTAVSDGYYAFFTLLLMAFAGFISFVSGSSRWHRGASVATVFCVVLVSIQLGLMIPLNQYKRAHPEEFLVNGLPDPALIKKPFEAEIYVSSLKLMIAPIVNHRIDLLAKLGRNLVATSDDVRIYKTIRPAVSLGTLGTILLAYMFILLFGLPTSTRTADTLDKDSLVRSSSSVLLPAALFAFLCSISGGLGTLLAMVFPSIRAYERFSLFLLLLLLLLAGVLMSEWLRSAGSRKALFGNIAILVVTAFALLDQIPRDVAKGDKAVAARFLAERTFIRSIENAIPKGSMIYQYPYSQYLTDNKYYGWGAFAHHRLYLHSKHLRWSNGASKNSPADLWHTKLSAVPLADWIPEVWSAGFRGIVVDRTVISPKEYEKIRRVLNHELRAEPIEDGVARLAYWSLPDPGFQVLYEPNLQEPAAVLVNSSQIERRAVPGWLDADALWRGAVAQGGRDVITIRRGDQFNVFRIVEPLSKLATADLRGDVTCSAGLMKAASLESDAVNVSVENRSSFDWVLNKGPHSIAIGAHIRSADGRLLRWDDGYRLRSNLVIRQGRSAELSVPLADLRLKDLLISGTGLEIEIELLQEGNMWFGVNIGNRTCRFRIEP